MNVHRRAYSAVRGVPLGPTMRSPGGGIHVRWFILLVADDCQVSVSEYYSRSRAPRMGGRLNST
jgi:hypothetical protein